LAKFLPLNKSSISSWLNFYLLAKPLSHPNNFFISQQNYYLFLAKYQPLDKNPTLPS
jgi:hypothetical protein